MSAFTQTTSNLTGIVRDATGAVVTAATIEARHVETGQIRSTIAAADGKFTLISLPAGFYEVRIKSVGFRPLIRKGIEITIGVTQNLDVVLEVGAAEQEITVLGQASPVNTATSELSYLVGSAAIRDLPLNGRNWTDLTLLQPGVVAFPHRDGGSAVAHGLGMSINGQDPRANMYLLDGTPMNDFTNGPAGSVAGTALGMDTIREFRVETNAYSAEFGRTYGGQIIALTRSGTNGLHGSLFHYLRNDNLDARNFFDGAKRPEFKRNQFGGTVGGPLRRDRSFFFVGYEGLREQLGRTISSEVPDADARLGIINGVNIGVNPAVKPFLDEFPLPNGPSRGSGIALYTFPFNQKLHQDFAQARFDHNFNAALQMFARYTWDKADQFLPTDYPQFPRSFLSRNQFATAELRQIITPTLLNTTRIGFSRTRVGQDVEANTSRPLPAFIPGRSLTGDIDVGGLQRFGPQSSVDLSLVQNVIGVEDGVSWQRGRHLLKIGGLAEHYQLNMVNPTFGLGIYTFNDLPSFLRNQAARFIGLSPNGALDRYWRFTLFGLYIQDDIKVTSRLTINAGLRYEVSTLPKDIYGRDSTLLKLSDPAPTTGQLYQNPTYLNISPRVGFAWDVFGNGRTSLRSGYGLYFNTNNQQHLIVTVTNPPATPRLVIANPTFPNPPFERGVGNSIRPVQYDLENPRLHVYNVNVQQMLPFDVVLMAGYAGSRGEHLLRSSDANIARSQVLPDGTVFFPPGSPRLNTAFSTIELKSSDGNSWYNALILEIRKRFSSGLSFQSSYTFARNIDTTQGSVFFSDATNASTTAFPEFPGFQYNKGLADYHAKHNWVMNVLYELPFGRDLQGFAGAMGKGWQLAAISNVRSGSPLTVFVRANRSRSQWAPSLGPGIGNDRASIAPGRSFDSAILGGPDRYFDPGAFVLQPAGTLGNLGRNTFIGPNLRTVDLSAMKNFRFSERVGLQFRAEAFNLLNRSNFGPPNLIAFAGSADTDQPLPNFGRIRNTVTTSRQIQFGLRLSF
ncbi:MAG: TonB-dependent receptor [Bryobacteraceae bacterium]|nr:TonB-dependent receptor [Bryobacteraceae bacterium]